MKIQINTLRALQYFARAMYCGLMIFCFLNIPSVGMAQDEDVATIRSAAEQGDASAQYRLGVAYIFGKGVKKDFREAVNWTRAAAEQGHLSAQYNLANMYYRGDGVAKDEEESFKWYRAAAEQGHAEAQYNIGLAYRDGLGGIDVYPYEAWIWLANSAILGYPQARLAVRRVPEPPLPARAFDIETGTVFMRGGILGTRKKFLLFMDLENMTDKRIWAEVSFRVPGSETPLRDFKKVNDGSTTRFSWAAPSDIWNLKYDVTISVFEDRRRKTPLGKKQSSYYFDENERADFEAQVWALESEQIYRLVGFRELLGLRDEMLMAEVPGTTAIGTTLRYDILTGLFAEESKVHEECKHVALKAERHGKDEGMAPDADMEIEYQKLESEMPSSEQSINERWFVQSCEAVSEYEVRLVKSRKGRTDILYRKVDPDFSDMDDF